MKIGREHHTAGCSLVVGHRSYNKRGGMRYNQAIKDGPIFALGDQYIRFSNKGPRYPPVGLRMAPAISDHEFNDDLLLAEPDRKLAARLYPTILHVLDHPELRQLFSEYDEPANRSKRKGRTAGFWVIAFGFSALAIAALEYPFTHATGDHFSDSTIAIVRLTLGALSAVCGIASVLIGSVGVLYARRKRDWLHLRLVGESIRQFHFQTLVFRLPEILASLKDDNAKSAFVLDRKLWFETFKSRFEGKLDAVFGAITNEENGIDPWLHEGLMKPPKLRETRDLAPLFDAYRKLRILHQLGYADYKLQPDHRIFSPVPRRQAEVISHISSVYHPPLCHQCGFAAGGHFSNFSLGSIRFGNHQRRHHLDCTCGASNARRRARAPARTRSRTLPAVPFWRAGSS